jgi:hypothetical protein
MMATSLMTTDASRSQIPLFIATRELERIGRRPSKPGGSQSIRALPYHTTSVSQHFTGCTETLRTETVKAAPGAPTIRLIMFPPALDPSSPFKPIQNWDNHAGLTFSVLSNPISVEFVIWTQQRLEHVKGRGGKTRQRLHHSNLAS